MKKIHLTLLLTILAFTACTQSSQVSGSSDVLTDETLIPDPEIEQVSEPLNPDDYVLETLLPEEGGSDCRLIEVATNKELASLFVDGIRGEDACKIIGFWGRTLFAQVLPDSVDFMGFYSPQFNFHSIDVDTGEVEDLGYFIGWVDQGNAEHKGAFSTDGGAIDSLIFNDFVNDKKVAFVVPEIFDQLGSPYLNVDETIVVFSAVESDYTTDFPTLLSTSIFIGDIETGLVKEIYSYNGRLNLSGWLGEEIEFNENGQTCSLDQEGLNKECQL
jgi:hypothetical protein